MTSSSHLLPPYDLQEEQYFQFLTSSSTSSLMCTSPSDFNPSQEQQGSSYHREILKQYQEAQEVDEYGSHGGSSDQQNYLSPPSLSTLESGTEYGIKLERDQPRDDIQSDKGAPVSWMSSKMRMMKKMIHSSNRSQLDGDKSVRAKLRLRDQKQSSSRDYLASNSTIIRTCSDCHTTRTPLWRGGPQGPKSLCNACGIRQRKARRALAAATAAANDEAHVTSTPSVQTKVHCFKKKSGKGQVGRQKKQCKPSATTPCSSGTNNVVFEDFIVNLSNSLALHRMIPQDDQTEAAILLMALSCGLVSG